MSASWPRRVGKTFLADALILAAGATTRLGRVDDGSSLFDFEPEEIRRRTTNHQRLPPLRVEEA